jgi:hypothetical protein
MGATLALAHLNNKHSAKQTTHLAEFFFKK